MCPFCLMQRGRFNDLNQPSDVAGVTDAAFVRISPSWWADSDGGALVIPRAHHENLYELPRDVGPALWGLVQDVAVAMRETYDCDGVSVRQHNEPSGGQDVWHLHVHVLPRHSGDRLYERNQEVRWVGAAERAPYADRLAGRLGLPRHFG